MIATNASTIAAQIGVDLGPTITAGLVGVAAAAQDVIAPYPPAPTPGNPWYERGYGRKYRRKDGRVTGRKTSETTGRKWSIVPLGDKRIGLYNTSSYSAYMHSSEYQTSQHKATGWKTEKDAEDSPQVAEAVDDIGDMIVKQIGG